MVDVASQKCWDSVIQNAQLRELETRKMIDAQVTWFGDRTPTSTEEEEWWILILLLQSVSLYVELSNYSQDEISSTTDTHKNANYFSLQSVYSIYTMCVWRRKEKSVITALTASSFSAPHLLTHAHFAWVLTCTALSMHQLSLAPPSSLDQSSSLWFAWTQNQQEIWHGECQKIH